MLLKKKRGDSFLNRLKKKEIILFETKGVYVASEFCAKLSSISKC